MKKIMFSDKFGLTEAVLSGRKTQTRRIVPQKDLDKACEFAIAYFNETFDVFANDKDVLQHYFFVEEIGKLPYRVGEVVAVAQRYRDFILNPISIPADMGWFNKLFVRADLMPHQIRIANVRVERLQDISDEDCIAEGVCKWTKDRELFKYDMADGFEMFEWRDMPRTPREAYAALIDRISGKGTFESNPYVFVYEFELIK
ncbi:hypothetical protein E4T81_12250 [Barnesiella sp. WM24]|uniref:hypothetical protein n=1 Tax=Barnesiella sp. WM24 TaxID=2558278 RepID=UPI001071AED5|nr:hypothetical protein [Barnesiella sp. WM24]TFU92353.1 hypothetical protein E4T81_12250 [Barnesiella sp. WM24]